MPADRSRTHYRAVAPFSIVLVAVMPMLVVNVAPAAERVVLAEEFTQTSCVPCKPVGEIWGYLIDTYPEHFAGIQIHLFDPHQVTWGFDRRAFYNVFGYPTSIQDGLLRHDGPKDPNTYEGDFLARRSVPTDVTLDVFGVVDPNNTDAYHLSIAITIEPGGTAKSLRLYTLEVLDHYPESETYRGYRNCVMQGLPTVDVDLQPGQMTIVPRTVVLGEESTRRLEDVRIIAWVQAPGTGVGQEVYQAAIAPLPLEPDCNANGVADATDIATGFSEDCNVNGVPDACDIASGTSQDSDGDGVPDECGSMVCPGDSNCDGFVNFRDIDYFVAAQNDNIAAWEALFGGTPACDFANNDTNGDGFVNFRDIDAFVALQNTTCP